MGDEYGAATVPLEVTTPAGDPAIAHLAGFCRDVLNAHAAAAWLAVHPTEPPVRRAHTHDPSKVSFNQSDLPAIFVHRQSGRPSVATQDWRQEEGSIRLLWIFPPDAQEKQRTREPIVAGLMKVLHARLYAGRDPAWVRDEDLDPDDETYDSTAPSFAADGDAIKAEVPTSTSAETYSGAELDGVVGAAEMIPRRALTVTTTAAAGQYNTAAPIVITFINWLGAEQTLELQLTDADGGETIVSVDEAARVVSIDVPAQVGAGGAIAFGTAVVNGLGSVLLRHTGFERIVLASWRRMQLPIEILGDGGKVARTQRYEGVEVAFTTREFNIDNLEDEDELAGVDVSLVHEDGTEIQTFDVDVS